MIRGFWQQLKTDSVSFRGDWFWAPLLWSWYKASHLGLVKTKKKKKKKIRVIGTEIQHRGIYKREKTSVCFNKCLP